jgi:hypothetical protein
MSYPRYDDEGYYSDMDDSNMSVNYFSQRSYVGFNVPVASSDNTVYTNTIKQKDLVDTRNKKKVKILTQTNALKEHGDRHEVQSPRPPTPHPNYRTDDISIHLGVMSLDVSDIIDS